MTLLNNFKFFGLAIICLFVIGCASSSGSKLTTAEIQKSGTMIYKNQSGKNVYSSTKQALKTLGYNIATENRKKGLIVTERMHVKAVASHSGGQYSASSRVVHAYRQYIVKLSKTKSGIKVKATPTVFLGPKDISNQDVWQIDGPDGEREKWTQLFSKIETFL